MRNGMSLVWPVASISYWHCHPQETGPRTRSLGPYPCCCGTSRCPGTSLLSPSTSASPIWVAPLVARVVDLSILGLLFGTRHLALHGATKIQLCSARRLLVFASMTTLGLNIAAPISVGAYGKAAFEAVGLYCSSDGPKEGRACCNRSQP
jgi:hypothetical protein